MRVRANLPLLAFLLVIGLAFAASGRVFAQATTNVQIAHLKLVGTTLTIVGENFGSGSVTVQVGQTTAAVTSSTDTEIVAETNALASGTHIVKVTRDASEGGSAMSTVRIR
jgi:hypothetical protein